MEPEQSQNFNERLSQWVASQGFWFQLRYSLAGSGAAGTATFHLLNLGFRLLIFLGVLALGAGYYTHKATQSKGYSDGLRDKLKAGLVASNAEMKGFSRASGELLINRFACQGGNDTFFTALEARGVRCKMGILDSIAGVFPSLGGVTKAWSPGTVTIGRLDLELRPGADDAESAKQIVKSLFEPSTKVLVDGIEVADATIQWGFTERTRGKIERSAMKFQRVGGGFKLFFKGGTFSQNWLNDLEILSLTVACDPEGITFEKAEFRCGTGTVDFSGLKVSGGERPTLSGTAKIRKMSLEKILPEAASGFLEGSISGDFNVFGSTNSQDGVGFDGQVALDGQDKVTLKDRIHLLKTLTAVGYLQNYDQVEFREGSFHLRSSAGGLQVTDVSLKADDLLTLDGRMRVRLPTDDESKLDERLGRKDSTSTGDPMVDAELKAKLNGIDFSIPESTNLAKTAKDAAAQTNSLPLFERLGLSVEARQKRAMLEAKKSRTLRYEGSFTCTLQADAFERAPQLIVLYPVDPKLGRIPLKIPIEGSLYELTFKQAEDLYEKGRRK